MFYLVIKKCSEVFCCLYLDSFTPRLCLPPQKESVKCLFSFCNQTIFCLYHRYNDGEDSISHFRVTLVDNVLVKLLWHDFFMTGSSKASDIINKGKEAHSSEENVSHNRNVDILNMKYPMPYLQELGKCFIEILLGIYIIDSNLLSVFIMELEDNCMNVLQQAGNVEIVERIILFMLLLEQHAVTKGATWPLVYIVGPMLAKSFSIIKSSVS